MDNPFNISFGETSLSVINRDKEFNDVVSTFDSSSPETKVFILTGARGCGKTVLLSKIKEYYSKEKNWVTVDLNQYSNMLEQLAAKIYEEGKAKHLFLKTEFNFSFKCLSFSIQGENPVTNVDSLLDKIFKYLLKKKIKVLITVDDVGNNNNVKQFSQAYQSFIREKYQAYLLMTGLYENVSNLQNTNNLTFLLRAPKIQLSKLSIRSIALSYEKYLKVNSEDATSFAKLTNGYAYGYQLLGNMLFKSTKKLVNKDILNRFDTSLEDNVYMKIWESVSLTEKTILFAMTSSNKVKEILETTKMSNSMLQVYKKRLFNAGIIDISSRGLISFSLPRFKEFVNFQKQLIE